MVNATKKKAKGLGISPRDQINDSGIFHTEFRAFW